MTRDEFRVWRNSPATKAFFDIMKDRKERMAEALITAAITPENMHNLNRISGGHEFCSSLLSEDLVAMVLVTDETPEADADE